MVQKALKLKITNKNSGTKKLNEKLVSRGNNYSIYVKGESNKHSYPHVDVVCTDGSDYKIRIDKDYPLLLRGESNSFINSLMKEKFTSDFMEKCKEFWQLYVPIKSVEFIKDSKTNKWVLKK